MSVKETTAASLLPSGDVKIVTSPGQSVHGIDPRLITDIIEEHLRKLKTSALALNQEAIKINRLIEIVRWVSFGCGLTIALIPVILTAVPTNNSNEAWRVVVKFLSGALGILITTLSRVADPAKLTAQVQKLEKLAQRFETEHENLQVCLLTVTAKSMGGSDELLELRERSQTTLNKMIDEAHECWPNLLIDRGSN